MSDLIRVARRNAKNWADKPESAAMWTRVADEIERLESDAENLRNTITSTHLSLKEREAEIERYRAALEEIAANKDMTLLGCAPHNEYMETSSADEEAAHQYGANKAFNQCADIARAALKESGGE